MTSFPRRLLLVAVVLVGAPWAAAALGQAIAGPTDTTGNGRGGEARPLPVVTSSTVPAALTARVSAPSKASRTRRVDHPAFGSLHLDVTAYCWTGNRTASGVWPQEGMAAGPWPFGTLLRVEGVGVVEVTDRYGHSTQLDVYKNSCAAAREFGRRTLAVQVIQ